MSRARRSPVLPLLVLAAPLVAVTARQALDRRDASRRAAVESLPPRPVRPLP